jgi:hypothetical protein
VSVWKNDGALHELHVVGDRVLISACSARACAESLIRLAGMFDRDDESRARAALKVAKTG